MTLIPEPTLDELLADPLVHLMMRSDGLTRTGVRQIMADARSALRLPAKPNT
ncbi:hypothetical protein AEAC466_02710 [Asticcacaulis sp. AC466]|uniref:hypothetical protein n=1 Tax=Asticcacaulis sp. AC466 TaxID=1282362 RepID=UPI0003C3F15B|nr:hypothetical protein [Asticcacaulis sp. AC466]ESQ86119.1 hypothetical protein AEAC466_02710 [Asticcacaulis sp. AC466]